MNQTWVKGLTAIVLCLAAPHSVLAGKARALQAIATHCESCHPPLPDSGWQGMTDRPLNKDQLEGVLYRMATEFSAFPESDEEKAIIDFLATYRVSVK